MAATKGSQEGTQEGIRTPMRCAILGGGTFAQNTYVPILEGDLWKFSKIAVDAVWSRSEETAKTLSLSMWHNKAEVHFGDAGLDAIIGSDSIEAVFIVLPPRPALEITLRCLRAGKHVLGEKPVGTNVEEIEAAIREHVGMGQWRPIWGIAENYRFEETYEFVSKIVAGLGGVITLSLNASCALSESSSRPPVSWARIASRLDAMESPSRVAKERRCAFAASASATPHASWYGAISAASADERRSALIHAVSTASSPGWKASGSRPSVRHAREN